jgi:hypothetical protein
LSASLAGSSTRHLAPSLTDRWILDLYMQGRYVGRARSDVVARGDVSESRMRSAASARGSLDSDGPPTVPRAVTDVSGETSIGSRPAPLAPPRPPSIAAPTQKADELAFGDDVGDPVAERAIDDEWITLADLHASLDDAPRVELPGPEAAIALIRPRSSVDVAAPHRAASSSPPDRGEVSRRPAPVRQRPAQEPRASAHVGLAILAGAVAGFAAVATFMVLSGRDDRRLVPSAAAEPLVVVAPVAMDLEPARAPTAPERAMAAPVEPGEAEPGTAVSDLPTPPPGSATAAPIVSPVVMPKTPISKTCDLALMYAQRGEIAQAIRRFENCLSPDRELVRQRIGQRGAAEVRAKAEKGQCDEAAAIAAQIESIEAAGAAKGALASLCGSRAREIENETAGR